MPCCCMGSTAMATENQTAAGPWGTYADCDVPLATLDQMFYQVSRDFGNQLTYAIYTGDSPGKHSKTYPCSGRKYLMMPQFQLMMFGPKRSRATSIIRRRCSTCSRLISRMFRSITRWAITRDFRSTDSRPGMRRTRIGNRIGFTTGSVRNWNRF